MTDRDDTCPRLLIVEDDPALRIQLKYALREAFAIAEAGTRAEAVAKTTSWQPAVVMLDLGLPPHPDAATEGLQALEDILRVAPATRVVITTGNRDRVHAVQAVALGAFDYQLKPVDVDALLIVLQRAASMHALDLEARRRDDVETPHRFHDLIGQAPAMRALFVELERIAPSTMTVLVLGESGTGKELVARALHAGSPRADRVFMPINCAAIPETLLESELFGHERGAFTGADSLRKGRFELAQGGTLFLDEIAEMPPALQVKLLRFLQERHIERVGGREQIPVDVRVIAATNRDLAREMGTGRFREDLYYRLSVAVVRVPPLRERGDDIVLLANTLLSRFAQQEQRRVRLSGSALEALKRHLWPGNVRELENRLQRAVVVCEGRAVEPHDLGLEESAPTPPLSFKEAKQAAERDLITAALIRNGGNVSQSARDLGLSRPVLHEIMTRLGIDPQRYREVS
ncbi:MAG TPA: PEP-CTERM-box response regulator transcription factor [Methylomirabilota bacterium]|nr:PEP-CTERM-box response regulator transcription factor [Methylomirabilota bacterium]